MFLRTALLPLSSLRHSPLSRPITTFNMALRTLSPSNAAALDEHLMSTESGFTLDQLMELAGLSVAQAVHIFHPPTKGKSILLACGPGNNGGDGLVAARHLALAGYAPAVYWPKHGKAAIFARLAAQLKGQGVPFVDDDGDFAGAVRRADLIVDAVFGFSFKGEVREPFRGVVAELARTEVPVLAVDAPSGWDVESGPPDEGPGKGYVPAALVSLTAPKPLVKWFTRGRHFVGGRFLSQDVADRFGLDIPDYKGLDQVVEVPNGDGKL